MTKPYKTKKEKVYYQLREEIIRGEIPPGERSPSPGIAEKCGVSEIPVREAVQQLLQESYLDQRAARGAYGQRRQRGGRAQDLRAARRTGEPRGPPVGAAHGGRSRSSSSTR